MPEREGKTNGVSNQQISVVSKATETTTSNYELGEVLSWIKSGKGKFSKRVKAVRQAVLDGDDATVSDLKRSLPSAMFSGTFHRRSAKDLDQHSGILCLDFDDLIDAEDTKQEVIYDPHIVSAFISPSGNGLKILIKIPADDTRHADAFESASAYMSTMYGIEADESGKDVSRLCFFSHDPELFFQNDAVELAVEARCQPSTISKPTSDGTRPGDLYNNDNLAYENSRRHLEKLGWTMGRSNADKTFCTRPDKERGISGTLWSNGNFYNFSSNASPLEAGQSYSPFALYTITEHSGDFRSAGVQLANDQKIEYGNKRVQEAKEEIIEEEKSSDFPVWTNASEIPDDLTKRITMKYPVLVDGLLHRGTKMILGGGSKSYKTWTLLNLALAVASGQKWFGNETTAQGEDVIFINFEVAHEFFLQRVKTVCDAMGIQPPPNMKVWSLRGISNDLKVILEVLKERISKNTSLIVVDPIYKGLAGRDENSAGDIGQLMNEVEAIVAQTGSAVAFSAHYSKGNQADKDALDRISGSGVFARDPDTIMGLTAHEEDGCFTVHSALRNFPNLEPFVVEWDFPLFKNRDDLNPNSLKKAGQKITSSQVIEIVKRRMPQGHPRKELTEAIVAELDVAKSTAYRRIEMLINNNTFSLTRDYVFVNQK